MCVYVYIYIYIYIIYIYICIYAHIYIYIYIWWMVGEGITAGSRGMNVRGTYRLLSIPAGGLESPYIQPGKTAREFQQKVSNLMPLQEATIPIILLMILLMTTMIIKHDATTTTTTTTTAATWGNTNRVVSNRVVSKGPLYPSKIKLFLFCVF